MYYSAWETKQLHFFAFRSLFRQRIMRFVMAFSCSLHEKRYCDGVVIVISTRIYYVTIFLFFFFFLSTRSPTQAKLWSYVDGWMHTRTHARSVSTGDWSPRHIGQATYCMCSDSPLKVNDEQWVIGLRARAFLRSVRRFCCITWARARATSNPRHTCVRVLFIDRSNTATSQGKSGNRSEKSDNRRKNDGGFFSLHISFH